MDDSTVTLSAFATLRVTVEGPISSSVVFLKVHYQHVSPHLKEVI